MKKCSFLCQRKISKTRCMLSEDNQVQNSVCGLLVFERGKQTIYTHEKIQLCAFPCMKLSENTAEKLITLDACAKQNWIAVGQSKFFSLQYHHFFSLSSFAYFLKFQAYESVLSSQILVVLLHTIRCTHFKCTVRCESVIMTTIQLQNHAIAPKSSPRQYVGDPIPTHGPRQLLMCCLTLQFCLFWKFICVCSHTICILAGLGPFTQHDYLKVTRMAS